MDAGDLIELEIADVAHGGVFVGRFEGRVVFVPDVLPGERVRVRLTDTRKAAFWRGEALEVREASPFRRRHVWAAADLDVPPDDRAGGADFGHIDLAHQRELKKHVVEDALRRIGKLDLPVTIGPAGEPDAETAGGTRWRTRVSLHVDDEGRIGPYAARSHRVIPVPDLPLADEAIEAAARGLRDAAPGRVDLVVPADGEVRVIPRPEGARLDPDPAREPIVERVGDRAFSLDAGGFWQVHRLAAGTLTRAVHDLLEEDGVIRDADATHLDLYGGVGLFASTMAALGGPATRVLSVESDPRASEHAARNLAEWRGATVEAARVERWLARHGAQASAADRARLSRGVVLLDPPRSGAGLDTVASIAALEPARVLYVACDPVALARDLAGFRTHGYETSGVRAIDLFPNSHHVEAVALLTRAASAR
jgi:tRNA/tmRNA/rRNA uracil-C5-methylase (TrmA/RlmC/RlmD family)